jgi:hypothetical protein
MIVGLSRKYLGNLHARIIPAEVGEKQVIRGRSDDWQQITDPHPRLPGDNQSASGRRALCRGLRTERALPIQRQRYPDPALEKT